VIIIFFLLAVSGMLSPVFMAQTKEGYAAAINQAGTLRMQSYRITASLALGSEYVQHNQDNRTPNLVEEYNQRMFSPRIHDVLNKEPSQEVLDTYHHVEDQWQRVMLPNLDTYLLNQSAPDQSPEQAALAKQALNRHLTLVDDFVNDIHRFVAALEMDAERKNDQLRIIQLALLFITFLFAVISIFLTKRHVLVPLQDLLACANAAREGDFSHRSQIHSDDELGKLGQTFNVMAENLSVIYANLEARVAEKTRDLERSNRTLELLYSTTKRLSDSSLSSETLLAVIHDIEHLLGANSGTICLGRPGDTQAFRFASTSQQDYMIMDNQQSDCTRCLGAGRSHRFQITLSGDSLPVNIYSTPIKDKQQQFGVMLIEFPLQRQLEPWQERLLETVASHVALAINVAQQVSENRRLALLEERSVIARELHDSIAQSLSYLKIQVSRLDKALQEDMQKQELLQLTTVLRSALNGAYRQLRELLTTFRLRISEADLGAAIKTTVDEFSERSGIEISYHNRVGNCRPSPNAEIHLIQIVREALSNIVRHAGATHASVSLSCNQEGTVELIVEDNGIGINLENDMMMHYGLPIMKERAERLGGDLSITDLETGGTRVALKFNVNESLNHPSTNHIAERLRHA
jgi:two-component system nitrate/nitrite sensor histidine kinase NarX